MHLFTKYFKRAATLLIGAATLAACSDSFIYDDEGDCDPYYKARFVFDMNLHWSDAFSSEVNAVTLYLVDPVTGSIVWKKSESGNALKADGYTMDINVNPGEYQMIAWCGEGVGEHFEVPEAEHYKELTCTLLRDHEEENGAVIRHDIKRLYHGAVRDAQGGLATLTFPDDEGTYVFTVPLIKDTNDINVVLQHLSGKPVDTDDFTFTVTADNGSMDWDNCLLDDEIITYFPHHLRSVATTSAAGDGAATDAGSDISAVSACMAEFTVSRMVKGNNMRLKIYTKEGEKNVDIPLIDYALMLKSSHLDHISDQDFLDRQDKYDISFFLDDDNNWVKVRINILSWSVVIINSDL